MVGNKCNHSLSFFVLLHLIEKPRKFNIFTLRLVSSHFVIFQANGVVIGAVGDSNAKLPHWQEYSILCSLNPNDTLLYMCRFILSIRWREYLLPTSLVNRWDGTPCKDRVDDLGLTWFTPFTVEKAREAVRLMGFIPKNDDVNDCIREDLEIGSIEIVPTRDGAESAWIDFAR